jgi:hypothetical protein
MFLLDMEKVNGGRKLGRLEKIEDWFYGGISGCFEDEHPDF